MSYSVSYIEPTTHMQNYSVNSNKHAIVNECQIDPVHLNAHDTCVACKHSVSKHSSHKMIKVPKKHYIQEIFSRFVFFSLLFLLFHKIAKVNN